MNPVVGAWSETFPADNIQSICDEVKPKVEEKTGKKYGTFRALKYRVNALIGATHYCIMVYVGFDDYLQIYVVRDVEGRSVVESVEEDHHRYDHIIIPKTTT